ncbi:MAG: 3-hydroxybutyryl-CoA dehydrogenase [Rhizobiaceae bacterium]|nr:3-hydroxybutyryl-CoA dehydrogenase [Rhizobiaceae bacterium]
MEAAMRSERIAVVGGGTMGVGIVYVFAMAGFDVTLVETSATRIATVRRTLAEVADGAVKRGKVSAEDAQSRIDAIRHLGDAADLPEALDLVVETVPERIEIKRDVLRAIDARHPKIIASNTSALSIDALAENVADASRFLGMHFFNPVWSLQLVELIRGTQTSDATLAAARAFAEAAGKTTITVRDVPGFATSRLDLIAALEAIRMLEDGVASADDIDRAMLVAYRHPIGPLRLSDMVGLDVRLDIARQLSATLGPRYAPPKLLEDMVARGDLGAKTGKGFFDWAKPDEKRALRRHG